MSGKYYEVEGAVFRDESGNLEVFSDRTGKWKTYEGDADRVYRLSNPMTLEEVQPYMAAPDERPAQAGEEKPA